MKYLNGKSRVVGKVFLFHLTRETHKKVFVRRNKFFYHSTNELNLLLLKQQQHGIIRGSSIIKSSKKIVIVNYSVRQNLWNHTIQCVWFLPPLKHVTQFFLPHLRIILLTHDTSTKYQFKNSLPRRFCEQTKDAAAHKL